MNEMDSGYDEQDAALDARLRAAFAPPRDVQRMARDVLAQSGVERPVSRWKHLRAVAAILIAVGGLSWFASRDASPARELVSIDTGQLHMQIAAVFDETGSCISPEADAQQLVTSCGGTELDYRGGTRVPLQGPLALPADWSGDPAATLLAGFFEGSVVVVVIENVEPTRESSFDAAGELNVHQRELGGYIVSEISSGDAPVCLDEFFVASGE